MENKPKYFQVMEDLKTQIMTGEIKAGDKLPSENVLSKRYGISRQTVRKALQQLQNEDYIYAEHGRGTFCSERMRHMKKSKNIAVITTYLSDYIFPRVIQGIDQVLNENGYSIVLKNTKNSRTIEAKILEDLLKKDIDGLIIEPSKSHIFCKHTHLYKMLDDYQIPFVFIQGSYEQMQDKPHILLDDCKGGYMITNYLIQLGHQNIVGIFKSDDMQGQKRHKGYANALRDAGIPYDPDKVIWFYTEDRKVHPFEQMRKMAREMKEMKNRKKKEGAGIQETEMGTYFDAVVCYNDQIALQVLNALSEEGISVPQEVSVTGYDNSYLAETCKVPLTSIAHPQKRLGEIAAELLLKNIRQGSLSEEERNVIIDPQIVERESCCPKIKK